MIKESAKGSAEWMLLDGNSSAFQRGTGQSGKAQKAPRNGALGLGSTSTNAAQGMTDAWARYAEDIMRNTSEATQALLRARTLPEMLGAQSNLLRNNMQAFLEQTARLAQLATLMASGPFDALRQTAPEQTFHQGNTQETRH